MLGLVFNVPPAKRDCPTLSHPSAAGGTAETLAATTLVPSVSPVSPNNYRWEENVYEEYAQRVLVAPPAAKVGQMRHGPILQTLAVGQQGRDPHGIAGPAGNRDDTITSSGVRVHFTCRRRCRNGLFGSIVPDPQRGYSQG
jgi:hypothetical protein